MEKEKENSVRCSKCSSTQVYLRLKTNQRYCRLCGFVEDLTKEENKGD